MFWARPPAKVNLTLEVVGRRDDGYHDLRSILLRVGLSDRLTMKLGPGPGDRLKVTGLPGAPTDGNLVLKAVDALRRHGGADLPPLDLTLDKRIPAAAGLGGGSSDAASAVRLAQVAWEVSLSPDDELQVVESLGSDVPFFYQDMPVAIVHGRGENLGWLDIPYGELGVLLVTPPFELRTRAVFARHDEIASPPLIEPLPNPHLEWPDGLLVPNPDFPTGRLASPPPTSLDDLLFLLMDQPTAEGVAAWAASADEPNDLWAAAASLEPSLAGLRDALQRATGDAWLMSGSGPTLFALYASAQEAAAAGQELAARRLPELQSALINAVDLVGPDPKWRFP